MSNRWLVEALQELQLKAKDAGHPISHAFVIVDGLEFVDKIRLGDADFVIYPTVPHRVVAVDRSVKEALVGTDQAT